ncbi:hypothetical protein KQX54_019480 [Cotesia glomerata]|uniref:Uncharacterized protein n=1 Tax=Cotesia glomerata TaxID=32391 RepID=A0AAV7I8E5_COTGL|nr:hypothetical protein KQX54_019480 [Cotesia glomerata]
MVKGYVFLNRVIKWKSIINKNHNSRNRLGGRAYQHPCALKVYNDAVIPEGHRILPTMVKSTYRKQSQSSINKLSTASIEATRRSQHGTSDGTSDGTSEARLATRILGELTHIRDVIA